MKAIELKVNLFDLLNVLDESSINQILDSMDYDILELEKESKKYRINLIVEFLGLKIIDIEYLTDIMALCLDDEKYDLFIDKLYHRFIYRGKCFKELLESEK